MIDRQVIATWITPEEGLPAEEDIAVVATVSGKAEGHIFDHELVLLNWCKDEGWYSMDYDFTELTVHAWCDLEAYGGYHGIN